MLRTALKGVIAHKVRLGLTSLAIVLGVAFVAGTFVFTDTINARFTTLFDDVYAGIDASIRPEQPEFGSAPGTIQGSLPEALLEAVASTEGVQAAAGSVGGFAQIIDAAGEPVGGQGPPTIGGSWIDEPALSALRITDGNGRAPSGAGEVVIDVGTAEAEGFELGDDVRIQTALGTETFEVVGLANFGTESNLAGATMSIFTIDEAQRLFGLEDSFTSIDVVAADGVSAEELVERLTAVAPQDTEVVTGDQQTQEQLDGFTEGLGFLTTALLAFAGVAVLVGAYVIQNTFRIVVAQRTRELALLRAVGATARQVTTLVALEAAIVGFVSSAIGVVSGIGVAAGIKAAMNAGGFGVPDGPLTVEPRTIIAGMTVGMVVTMASALLPARKASRVPPVAAMTETQAPTSPRSLRKRTISGVAVTALGAALLVTGLTLENGATAAVVGAGSFTVFVGISILAPVFAIPIGRLLGRPLPGITGELARENTVRQPRRTASTAAALMIGIALVSFVSIFAASIRASVTDTLEQSFPADLAFSSTNFLEGVSPTVESELEGLEEIATVSAVRTDFIRIDGQELNVGIVAADVERVYDLRPTTEIAEIGEGMLIQRDVLAERGWTVGDVIDVEYPAVGLMPTTIVGTFEDQTFGNYIVGTEAHGDDFFGDAATIVFARLADGVSLDEGIEATQPVLAAFPNIDMNTKADQIAEAEAQVNQMVALFSGLLGLAVIIAVLGIANTLALSIVERTREIGLLRAVGMSRRQVRRMIRAEAVIVAIFGAILGVGVGIGLGWATVSSLADDGLSSFALPAGQLGLWLALAALAGVIAAAGPARKAAKMNVLSAISYE
ncbi:MAG: FtsX-like permease family protein [Acidimicrobiia bacterium]|nr:FtsX-like permease family protein [Acidimicrobiia bacterium]